MRSLSRTLLAATAAIAMATLGGDCDGDVVDDPTFRDWCGSTLCAWSLDSGHIAQVPTWSATDLGVAFLDQNTEISQSTTESSATCLLFTTTADLDPSAQMELLVDFNSDGTTDATEPLGATDWHRVQAEIPTPPFYAGITFRLKKLGAAGATAVLAEMRVQSTTGCARSIPPRSLLLGESCASGNDCVSDVCDDTQVCAECSEAVPCSSLAACEKRLPFFPAQCAPGQHLGASGAPCVFDDDCASGQCGGAVLFQLSQLNADAGPPAPSGTDPMTACQTPPADCAAIDAGEPCGCTLNVGGLCR
jgi:hypothetical protein